MARAPELAVTDIEESAQAILGHQVALVRIGPSYQEIDARPCHRCIALGERDLLSHDWRQVAVEGEKESF